MAAREFGDPLQESSKHPVKTTDSSDPIACGAVCTKVAKRIGKDWRWLGRELGLEHSEVAAVEAENRDLGLEETVYEMLQTWIRKMGEHATLKALVGHLKNVNRADLAFEITKTK